MCQVFFDMFDHARSGSSRLPTTGEVLEAASVHSGIMPYLSLRHLQTDGDCNIRIFAPAWLKWLKLASPPRRQSDMAGAAMAARKSGILFQAGLHRCGFHEVGTFSHGDQTNLFVETLSLPAQSDDDVMNIFGFAVPFPRHASDPGAPRPSPARGWLDLGHGVPAFAPASTMSLAA